MTPVSVPELPDGFPENNPIDHFIGARIATAAGVAKQGGESGVNYFKEVRPILKQHCYDCHQGGKAKGGRGRGAREDAGPYNRTGAKACNNCGEIGHLAGACPEPSQCHACGSTAHSVANGPNKDKTCDICGKVGHLKAKCRALLE